ncbi:uncharacterized protein LOC9644820 [Selaginella moellendorffii]|uniref:uncharacterized protein LOC9644820 n=1 Tax=Selaginella moellendorffii TaxID=88036 RepID=UPI000D1CC10E|nr:uncharacterized protein LOC9644820 [Selaginella moellendorffii]|eukprot:XP_024521433.1 uncharacterized protein LOC9644820 [Selaginella moellendorffii]
MAMPFMASWKISGLLAMQAMLETAGMCQDKVCQGQQCPFQADFHGDIQDNVWLKQRPTGASNDAIWRLAQHCYCCLLEVLVNVWAYHSARRLIYVDPETGIMMEQNALESRRRQMKVKWFSFSVLKGMDEDMAEKVDDEHPTYRWLWPHTGEVFWQGILERERQERYNMKLERKRRNKERLARMCSRYKQKSLGRYVKSPPEEMEQDQAVNTAAR